MPCGPAGEDTRVQARPHPPLLAAELNSWTWSRGRGVWELGVLHHSGAQAQTLNTVALGAPSLAQAPAGTLSLENLLPLLGRLSSGEPFGLRTGRAERQEGERKTEGWARSSVGGTPTALEKLDLIWQ